MNYLHVCHFNIICYSWFAAYRLKTIAYIGIIFLNSQNIGLIGFIAALIQKKETCAILIEFKITKKQSGEIFLRITG